jgi:threonine/homoserine efflux transporter RhtA
VDKYQAIRALAIEIGIVILLVLIRPWQGVFRLVRRSRR